MVDTINSVGGFVAPLAGASINTPKPQTFAAASSPAPVQRTGGNTVVEGVRYTSPVFVLDPSTRVVVYQQRDPITGQVLNQYPSEKAVAQYQKADQQSGAPLTDAKINKPVATTAAPVADTAKVDTNTKAAAAPTDNKSS